MVELNTAGERTLILFAKEPKPGTVKTRLGPLLTPKQSAAVAEAFLRDSAALVREAEVERRVVSYAPVGSEESMRARLGEGFVFEPQAEGDLGLRLRVAFDRALTSANARVVAIGADAPTLPPEVLAEAFDALERHDVVIGPALDLGYYLIGLRRPLPELFVDLKWGTAEVLPTTLARLRCAQVGVHLLPPWYDVDTPDELAFLRAHIDGLSLDGRRPVPKATTAVLEQFRQLFP
jgi:rSAM/selenodomain-associated transferase 1